MTRRRLSLHQLSLLDVGPADLIDIAASLGCPHVCVFVKDAGRATISYPVINDEGTRRAVLERADACGVSIHNVEVFLIRPDFEPAAFEPALAMGAALGAERLTALIADADLSRAFQSFSKLCECAAAHGLAVHLEFHAFSEVKTLTAARRFLAYARPANASLALDALHLYRNDGGLDGLDESSDIPIGYAQICDGPLSVDPDQAFSEAVSDRLPPGEGAFDLPRFIRAIPKHVVIDVEAPSTRLRAKGLTPPERARHIVEAARRVIALADA